jgi:hypothetical protein
MFTKSLFIVNTYKYNNIHVPLQWGHLVLTTFVLNREGVPAADFKLIGIEKNDMRIGGCPDREAVEMEVS